MKAHARTSPGWWRPPEHAAILLVVLAGDAVAGGDPPRYFPLDAGRAWTFVNRDSMLAPERREIQVLAREGDVALVRFQPLIWLLDDGSFQIFEQPYDLVLRERGLEIDILMDGEFLPFYRFGEETFLHHDVGLCEDGIELRVLLPPPTETPAGVFADCLRMAYVGSRCADGGRAWETFCPGIGPVEIGEKGPQPGVAWVLSSFEPSPKNFIRGDANADGAVNLSDAFAILNALFIWGQLHHVPCDDAADANDDGAVNISDAIFTLTYLFGGGRPVPAPGAEACGPDPSDEDLHCGSYFPCCVGRFCPR